VSLRAKAEVEQRLSHLPGEASPFNALREEKVRVSDSIHRTSELCACVLGMGLHCRSLGPACVSDLPESYVLAARDSRVFPDHLLLVCLALLPWHPTVRVLLCIYPVGLRHE